MNSIINETLNKAAPFSEDFLAAFAEASLPLQVAMLRQHYGFSQGEMATSLDLKQAYFSRLEHENSDHMVSQYEEIAKLLHAQLAFIPNGTKITTRKSD